MAIKIHVVPATGLSFERVLDSDSVVIGRSRNADLVIPDEFLSRKHARLYLQGSRWMIEDLGSQNGTWLNGAPVRGESAPVEMGAMIKLSDSSLTINEDAKPRPTRIEDNGNSLFVPVSEILDRTQIPDNLASASAASGYIEQLKLINDIHQALGQSITLSRLLDLIIDRVFAHLQPEEATVFLMKEDGSLYPAATRSPKGGGYLFSQNLIHEVAEKGMAALVYDAESDDRFSSASSIIGVGIRSLVAAPLMDADQSLGMIVLSSKATVRQFTEDDLALLVSLASIASLRIRNIALSEEAGKRRRLEEELSLARRIQVALLPNKLPPIPGYELYADNQPSRGVSGDFFQITQRSEEWVFLMADVSGKGMSASLLTASLEALAAGPIEDGFPPEQICDRLSQMIYRRTPPERYATMFLSVLRPEDGRLTYANAGHNPPLLIRESGEIELLPRTGLPIGLLSESTYESRQAMLGPGDLLVLYTDGITEANDPEGAEYGLKQFQKICRENRTIDVVDLGHLIDESLEEFAKGVPFPDDRSLILIRRNRSGGER